MERSGSQKALLVLSIIEIVCAVLALIGGISIIALGGYIGAGLMAGQLTPNQAAYGSAGIAILSIVIIVSAVWSLLCGIFGIRAANDNQKIMIVWVFTLIGVILGIIGIVASIINGTSMQNMVSLIISLIFDALLFWIANNIKREAGK